MTRDARTTIARHLAEADVALDAINGDFIHDMGVYSAVQAIKALRYAVAVIADELAAVDPAEQPIPPIVSHVEWRVRGNGFVSPQMSELEARRYLADQHKLFADDEAQQWTAQQRLVGPWRDAEADPTRHNPLTDEPCGVIPTPAGRQLVADYRAHRTRQNPQETADA